MEHQKILNLLSRTSDSRFTTRMSNTVNDKSNAIYAVWNEIIYSTEILKSNICDYNNACIQVKGDLIINGQNQVTQVAF